MVSVNNVTMEFGGSKLFNEISFMVNPRDRIGLVGRNGAGKSTLLKIMSGKQKQTSGTIVLPSGITVGYLPQHMIILDDCTVYKEADKAFDELNQLHDEIAMLNEQLNIRTDYDTKSYLDLIEQMTHASERLHLLGDADRSELIEKTLLGMGFKTSDFNRPTREFSGGWRMRIELVKLLIQMPDLLMLDEPTNHLDIESIEWMEEFMRNYRGALILISHDKAFLDNVTSRTVEISMGKIFDYKVPYSKYLIQRAERRMHEIASYQNQQKMIEKTEEFIDRFRYKASKSIQVQSRIKQLDKVDRIEIEEEDKSSIVLRFPPAPRSGTIVAEAKEVSKSYGSHQVLKNCDLIIERGEKVAFVGRNGEGKTTMSRIIMGETDFEGDFKLGHNVNIGYFAQNQDELLDESRTVLQTIDDIAVGDIRARVRDILGAFLFGGDDVDKKVKVLSGGERSRLAIAKLLLKPYNLLVLDEPTNHLDMRSKDVLKQALMAYDGSIIIVSHDREFLSGLVTKVHEFRDKKIKENIGDIWEFLKRRKAQQVQAVVVAKKTAPIVNVPKQEKHAITTPVESLAPDNKIVYAQRKLFDKELRKVENDVETFEKKIASIEKEIKALDERFLDPEVQASSEITSLIEHYQKLKNDLKKEIERWEVAGIELELLRKKRTES